MAKPLRVLIVEDSAEDVELLLAQLRRDGYALEHVRVDTREAMDLALAGPPWDVILSDLDVGTFGAMQALALLQEKGMDLPLIVVSAPVGEETAVEAIRAGARDVVFKKKLSRLQLVIEREVRQAAARAEQRTVHEQLRHSQKMDAVGRLAGGVAHDFNNLLSVILTFSELRIRELPENDPIREDLEEIRKAGERAAALTRQLLAFSRQQAVDPKPLSLNDVVQNVEKMLRRLIREDIELKTVLAPDLKLARADAGLMEQVLVNLVVNARDAMPKAGQLTLFTANVMLDGGRGPHVMLSVTDTGVGMSKDTVDRIFEPFFTTKEQGLGAGLGLSTVFGIVQQLGGSLSVRSEEGKGSTFEVYLPQAREVSEEPRETQAQTLRGDETILLVEDEDQVRKVARGILARGGYRVLEASRPEEAVALCEKHPEPIELLLTDVVMPQMNGPKLAERLLAMRPSMKVLFMSGYTDEAALRGVFELGRGFIQKPLTPDVLSRKVREVLAGGM